MLTPLAYLYPGLYKYIQWHKLLYLSIFLAFFFKSQLPSYQVIFIYFLKDPSSDILCRICNRKYYIKNFSCLRLKTSYRKLKIIIDITNLPQFTLLIHFLVYSRTLQDRRLGTVSLPQHDKIFKTDNSCIDLIFCFELTC